MRILPPESRTGGGRRQLVFPHGARHRARTRHQVRRDQKAGRRFNILAGRPGENFCALRGRGSSRRNTALYRGRESRRPAANHRQGTDDRHRLYRLRPGLGRALYSRQQARLEAVAEASGTRYREQIRHPRRSRAGALGGRSGDAGRDSGRLRLRARAMLLDVASSDQLDGRQRLPAPSRSEDPPAQSGGRYALSSTAR